VWVDLGGLSEAPVKEETVGLRALRRSVLSRLKIAPAEWPAEPPLKEPDQLDPGVFHRRVPHHVERAVTVETRPVWQCGSRYCQSSTRQ